MQKMRKNAKEEREGDKGLTQGEKVRSYAESERRKVREQRTV